MPEKKRYPQFSDNLKRLQRQRGLKGAQIARKLKIPRNTYSNYERGITLPKNIQTLVNIKYALNVSFEELLKPYLPRDCKINIKDQEIEEICNKVREYCEANEENKTWFIKLLEMKLPSRIELPKDRWEGGGNQSG